MKKEKKKPVWHGLPVSSSVVTSSLELSLYHEFLAGVIWIHLSHKPSKCDTTNGLDNTRLLEEKLKCEMAWCISMWCHAVWWDCTYITGLPDSSTIHSFTLPKKGRESLKYRCICTKYHTSWDSNLHRHGWDNLTSHHMARKEIKFDYGTHKW